MYQHFVVAIAIILEKNGKLLLGKRSATQDFASGVWEFPAGRVEKGETPEKTIEREALEELGIKISEHKIIDAYTFDRAGVDILLLNYICKSMEEPKKSEEHDELRWVDPNEALSLFTFERQKQTVKLYLQSR